MVTTIHDDTGPVFIGGQARSGKTYLRMMLAAHPRLALSRRTNMWTDYYGRFGSLARPANFERCLRALLRRKHIRALDPDVDAIRRAFARGEATYGRLFAIIHAQWATRAGKARWGDQTGGLERRAAPLMAAYPDARLIQLIRDPRDRFAALVARDPRSRARIGAATVKWLDSAALARRNSRAFPGRYLVVRYESLVSRPAETMQTICAFLNLAYDPALLTLSHEPRFAAVPPGQSPLTTAYVANYHTALTRPEIAFIQARAGAQMVAHHYSPAAVDLTAGEKFHFYLTIWAPGVAQMSAWRARDALRDRRTARAPDAATVATPAAALG